MFKRSLKCAVFFQIFVAIFVFLPCHAQSIRIVTEDLPPFQVLNPDKSVNGAMVEVIKLLLQEAQLEAKIEVYPWARSYQLALNEPNTIIFSLLRDKLRENKFHWLGHLYSLKTYFAVLESRTDIEINDIGDVKNYRVGVIRKDLAEDYLLAKGFKPDKNLYISSVFGKLWKQLYNGRTDIVMTNNIVWRHELNHSRLDPNKLKLIYQIPDFSSELYLAASLSTEQKIIEKFKIAYNKIKSDGRFQKIMKKWQLSK